MQFVLGVFTAFPVLLGQGKSSVESAAKANQSKRRPSPRALGAG